MEEKKECSLSKTKKKVHLEIKQICNVNEESRIQESLVRAFDENDLLRNRIVELESLLVGIQVELERKRQKCRIFETPSKIKLNVNTDKKRSRSI